AARPAKLTSRPDVSEKPLTQRELNRALLARQLLLGRAPLSIPAGGGADGHGADAVRALGVRRALVTAPRLPSRRPHRGARAADRRAGNDDAEHDSRRLAARLLAARARDPARADGVVPAGPEDRAARARAGGAPAPRLPFRPPSPPGGDRREARRRGLAAGNRDLARPRARTALRHVGAPPRRPLRSRRGVGRAGARARPRRGGEASRPSLPGRVRPGRAHRDRRLGRDAR